MLRRSDRIAGAIVVHQHLVRRAFQIVELPCRSGPPQHCHQPQDCCDAEWDEKE